MKKAKFKAREFGNSFNKQEITISQRIRNRNSLTEWREGCRILWIIREGTVGIEVFISECNKKCLLFRTYWDQTANFTEICSIMIQTNQKPWFFIEMRITLRWQRSTDQEPWFLGRCRELKTKWNLWLDWGGNPKIKQQM